MNWISVEIGMPLPYRPVLVAGGCAYWDGTFWYTYMERNHPRIQWDVKYWAPLPKLPTSYRIDQPSEVFSASRHV